MMKKEHLKIEGERRKKAKRENLNVDEREQLRKYEQKGKKGMLDNLSNEKEKRTKIEKTKSNNLDNNEKEH